MALPNKKSKTAVFLINLGTPDSPNTPDVRKYLRQFLMDRRVIDIPWFNRWMLINMIIAPFRAPKSAHEYKKLWTEKGSPLMFHGVAVKELLQQALGDSYKVVLGMRYQNPSIESAAKELEGQGYNKIIVIPLFPQYASASTGSAVEEALRVLGKWEITPHIEVISKFFDHPLFIKAFAEIGRKYLEQRNWDHIIFSYHGIPERQITKASVGDQCKLGTCCQVYGSRNEYCYRAQCYETTRLLVKELGLAEGSYSVSFQSRLGKTPWIKPYTDHNIEELAKAGKKSILFYSPSFIADCLETTIEGGEEYKELFEENGGKDWQLIESLNTHPTWIECLKDMVVRKG
jgi:protoporphyrin/coproporphyrin ferrochelatase